MGLVSYRNYWRLILSYHLRDQKGTLSIADLSERTGMTADDIVSGLVGLRALVRDPITKTYALRLDYKYFDECVRNWESKGYVQLNPDALIWTPYIMGRSNQSHFDRAPLHARCIPRQVGCLASSGPSLAAGEEVAYQRPRQTQSQRHDRKSSRCTQPQEANRSYSQQQRGLSYVPQVFHQTDRVVQLLGRRRC